jgi:hypothetical protein
MGPRHTDTGIIDSILPSRLHMIDRRERSRRISGTVDIVGKTLALPFRFVSGLIDLVF